MQTFEMFFRTAKSLFVLAGKAGGIREMDQIDTMAHIQLKLAQDAARAEEIEKNPTPKKWWNTRK